MTEYYNCPQCEDGKMKSTQDGQIICQNCELDMAKVLRHLRDNGGPLEDVSRQLLDIMIERKTPVIASVYLIKSSDGFAKIGVSKRPENRLKEFNTASPYELELVTANRVKYPYRKEEEIHEKYDEFRADGEWFDIASDDVRDQMITDVENLPFE